jgi:hypothetical protein
MKNHLSKNTLNYFSRLSELVDENHNRNWMKDWMEQADNFKNNSEALKLLGDDVDGFLKYADRVEGKYV